MLTWFATIAASWHRLIVACEVPSKGEAIFHEVTEVFAISIPSPSLPPSFPYPLFSSSPAFFPSVEQLHLFPRSWYARLLIMRAVSDLERKSQTGTGRNSGSFDGMACKMACRWYPVWARACRARVRASVPRESSVVSSNITAFRNIGKFVITCAHT